MKTDFYINGFGRVCGSVSSGTHRPEDLIKAFSDELAAIKVLTPRLVREARAWLAGDVDWQDTVWDAEPQVQNLDDDELGNAREDRGYGLIQDLQSALNWLAPEGFYFGAHEGDGADFGWWREDSETVAQEKEQTSSIVINPFHLGDGAYVSRGSDHSFWFAANDHRNVTVCVQREDMISLMLYIIKEDPALASVMANQVRSNSDSNE